MSDWDAEDMLALLPVHVRDGIIEDRITLVQSFALDQWYFYLWLIPRVRDGISWLALQFLINNYALHVLKLYVSLNFHFVFLRTMWLVYDLLLSRLRMRMLRKMSDKTTSPWGRLLLRIQRQPSAWSCRQCRLRWHCCAGVGWMRPWRFSYFRNSSTSSTPGSSISWCWNPNWAGFHELGESVLVAAWNESRFGQKDRD